MTEPQSTPWVWWMAPARFIGRLRPWLLAAAKADAGALSRLPRFVGTILIPATVIGLAAAFAALHAFSSGSEPALPLNWLRLHMDNIYTEVPLFIIAASVIGALSPSAAVLFVLSFGAFDLVAAAMHPEELHMWALRPFPIVGRLVAYWLLWLLAVEVPIFGRLLALSVRRLAHSRLAVAALCGAVTGGLTLLWTHGAAALIRPVYVWSDIGGPYAEGFIPIQNGGNIFALVAGGTAFAVALMRGPSQLLQPAARPVQVAQEQPGMRRMAISVARQIIVAALLTIGLGGLILTPLDAAVVFVALAGARPLARLLAQRSPIGQVMDRLPPVVRLVVAIVLVFGVSFFLIYAPVLRSVSEFFSVIVVFALGLFVIELVTARGSGGSRVVPSLTRAAGAGLTLGIVFFGMTGLTPMPVLADNGASLQDLWAAFDAAVLAGLATPVIIWLANAARPDEPTLVEPPPPTYPPPPPPPDADYPPYPPPPPPEPDADYPPYPPPPPPEPDADYPPYPTPDPPPPEDEGPATPDNPNFHYSDSSDDDLDELDVQR